jgi:hypothetical protein
MLLKLLLLGTGLIACGTGSYRLRRWAQPVTLIFTGTWAARGLLGIIEWLIVLPTFLHVMSAGAAATQPTTAATTGQTTTGPAGLAVALGTMQLLFGVLLPTGGFLFYRRHVVKQTLDHYSPAPVWTDRAPTPVLAACFWLWLASLFLLNACLYAVVPMFGRLVIGPPALVVLGVGSVGCLVLAIGMFRRRPLAWAITTLAVLAVGVSSIVTFARVSPADYYRAAGYPAAQVEMLRHAGVGHVSPMLVSTCLYGAAAIAYLLWIRKYFFGKPADNPA